MLWKVISLFCLGCFLNSRLLCRRWDTPQHVLMDDVTDTNRPEIWPGKDYSNPRMSDFYGLDKPDEDMYDRMKIPRMPWYMFGFDRFMTLL